MTEALELADVSEACAALSGASGFWFTRRNLMFELIRRRVWADPGADLEADEAAFAEALAAYEADAGRLDRLVRPEDAVAGIEPTELERYDLPADLFDYAIGRVALIERLDLCLMLIANGFHRNIEVALTVPPDFPSHVWTRIHAQLDGGMRTTFIAINDFGGSSGAWFEGLDGSLGRHEHAELLPEGLTMPWVTRLRVKLLGGTRREPGQAPPATSYALIEELPPLRLLRWVYGRVSTGAEDVGFG